MHNAVPKKIFFFMKSSPKQIVTTCHFFYTISYKKLNVKERNRILYENEEHTNEKTHSIFLLYGGLYDRKNGKENYF